MRKGGKYYSPATKMIHWLMAIIIIGLLVVGTLLENMANGPEKFELMDLHKSVGVLALLLFFLPLTELPFCLFPIKNSLTSTRLKTIRLTGFRE